MTMNVQHEILGYRLEHESNIMISRRLIDRYLNAKTARARLEILAQLCTAGEQLRLLQEAAKKLDDNDFTFERAERENKILKAKQLHRAGYSYAQIARELNISKSTAYRYIHKS